MDLTLVRISTIIRLIGEKPVDVREVFQRFRTQEEAVEYLERVRWRDGPACAYCGGSKVCRHASGDRARQRWQCWTCERAFSATVGTIFHGTHVPLRSWFLLLAVVLGADGRPSASGIARDLGMRRATVSKMIRRVRSALRANDASAELLYGIVGADGHGRLQPLQRRRRVEGHSG